MPSEDADQIILAGLLRSAGVFFEHPPLGGKRPKGEGRRLRKMGALKGSSDIRIYDVPPKFPDALGVSFELKNRRKPKELPPDQEAFLIALMMRGWVCSWGDVFDAIAWFRWLGYGV